MSPAPGGLKRRQTQGCWPGLREDEAGAASVPGVGVLGSPGIRAAGTWQDDRPCLRWGFQFPQTGRISCYLSETSRYPQASGAERLVAVHGPSSRPFWQLRGRTVRAGTRRCKQLTAGPAKALWLPAFFVLSNTVHWDDSYVRLVHPALRLLAGFNKSARRFCTEIRFHQGQELSSRRAGTRHFHA